MPTPRLRGEPPFKNKLWEYSNAGKYGMMVTNVNLVKFDLVKLVHGKLNVMVSRAVMNRDEMKLVKK